MNRATSMSSITASSHQVATQSRARERVVMNLAIEPQEKKGQEKEGRIDQYRNNSRSEKDKGKASMIWADDPSADKLFDKSMMNYNYPRTSLRGGSTSSPTVGSCSWSSGGESHNSSGFGNMVSGPVSGSLGLVWSNTEEMLLSLKDSRCMQMKAICALYRQGRNTNEHATIRLSYAYYEKIKRLAIFLTAGNVDGPCVKTSEELEETFKGSVDFCLGLVSTYASELYHIYSSGLDLYFR